MSYRHVIFHDILHGENTEIPINPVQLLHALSCHPIRLFSFIILVPFPLLGFVIMQQESIKQGLNLDVPDKDLRRLMTGKIL